MIEAWVPREGWRATSASAELFEDFFRREYAGLVRALFISTRNLPDAEEFAQEAMARAFERWDRICRTETPSAYVYTIGMNLLRRRLRLRARATKRAREDRAESDKPLDAAAALKRDVRDAVASLPRAQREALVLVVWYGLSPKQAAALLGISSVSVRGRLHRARSILRSTLGESYD